MDSLRNCRSKKETERETKEGLKLKVRSVGCGVKERMEREKRVGMEGKRRAES